jgi:hypothetical protein
MSSRIKLIVFLNLFQALYHPFITGESFTGPYEPVPETARIVSMVLFSYFILHTKRNMLLFGDQCIYLT